MKKNMGTTDRVIRIMIAVVFAVLFFADIITGTLGIVLLVVSGIFLVTGITGICPLYYLFGLSSTKKIEKAG